MRVNSILSTIALLLLLISSYDLQSQQDLKRLEKRSPQVFVYKTTADLAEQYMRLDSIDIDYYLRQNPVIIFPKDSVDENKLDLGHYVFISVEDNRIIAEVISKSNLFVFPVNNRKHVQLMVTGKDGVFIKDAVVTVNGKEASFRKDAQSYWVKPKNPDESLVKVYTSTDTLFSSLWIPDELKQTVAEQKFQNFKRRGIYRVLTWMPVKMKRLLHKQYYSRRKYRPANTGMMVFNQPKYKQTDTVKLKAYLFNRKWKVYNKSVDVFLEYYANGKSNKVFLQKVLPAAPGSFVFQFPLSDTLPSDINYTVAFVDDKENRVFSKNFRIEDYLLDEITNYTFRSEKDIYYPLDTLQFYAAALDANGLSILDGRTKIALVSQNILNFYEERVYVPDTIYAEEKPLRSSGDTRFDVPSANFPNATINLTGNLQFINANNEVQEKEVEVSYRQNEKLLKTFLQHDSVVAELLENGKPIAAKGMVVIHNKKKETRLLDFPAALKIDPIADAYTFYLLENGKKYDSATLAIEDDYTPTCRRISRSDSIGISINNPYRVPVSFTVFDGNKIVAMCEGDDLQFEWLMKAPSKKRIYRVNWQYYWKGEEHSKEENIALLYKLLQIDVRQSHSVFPGQNDSLTIKVRDYKGRPASNVNLTAFSYNNQFSKDIHVQEPPYLVKYKIRPHFDRNTYEHEDVYVIRKYPLGKHSDWMNRLRLDTMLYYKMLFPKDGLVDVATPIGDFLPQLSVHVSSEGERKEIYLLYVNRRLVYYNGVTEKMKDAYQTYLGYTQIGIRLYDQFIEIDSIYIQPNYKHDLFIDINKLPPHSKVTKLSNVITNTERLFLENNLWSLDDDYKTNEGYIWQGEKQVKLSGNRVHLVGPFRDKDSLHFFAPERFDIHFQFESGYQYNISNKVLRLERRRLYPNNGLEYSFPTVASPEWILGDTLMPTPIISYEKPVVKQKPVLKLSGYAEYGQRKQGNGHLYFTIAKDTFLQYVILFPKQYREQRLIMPGSLGRIENIKPGIYTLWLVNRNDMTAVVDDVIIKQNQTLCINATKVNYDIANALSAAWLHDEEEVSLPVKILRLNEPVRQNKAEVETMPVYEAGKSGIKGKIVDKKGGLAIPGAAILIKGSKTTTTSGADGSFSIANIKPGKCVLVISSIGYTSRQINVDVPEDEYANVEIAMVVANMSLNEVVVVGYGTQKKMSLTASVSVVNGEPLTTVGQMLMGRVPGVTITDGAMINNEEKIMIRGVSSLDASSHPLYVIDGILYDKMPENISPDMISGVTVLKNTEAVAVYGSRGANGVVIISTKTKNVRTKFRDYAFWQPQLFTDKNGIVKFTATYPDNITGWQIYVLAMDRKRRMGKTESFVQSYKPLLAGIAMPQFLVEGDSVILVGKALNYTNNDYQLKTNFSQSGHLMQDENLMLKASAAAIKQYPVIAGETDSLKAAFAIETNTGFKDEEEKSIPIIKKGTEEVNGQFWVLDRDTAVTLGKFPGNGPVEIFAQNNTLEVLLNEIDALKKYPYYCMEQTASKLRGLLMEKTIFAKLNRKFEEQPAIDMLISKLQKAQLYEGAWSWWEGGNPDFYISNYVINALLPLRADNLVETNIRNGLLYLQNQLPVLNKDQRLAALVTMSEARHETDYGTWLDKIDFDSLTVLQQWQLVKIKQQQNFTHTAMLEALMHKAIKDLPAGMHWGEETYRWYNNIDAVTVLAFEVLSKEKNHEEDLKSIMQYFLSCRRNGYWQNTVASASIVAALLPYVLERAGDFMKPASLQFKGDSSFTIQKFPFKTTVSSESAKQLHITKTGGGLIYLTSYQRNWNKQPEPVTNYFQVQTYFERNGQRVANLKAGEKAKMMVEINASSNAEYLMVEIPIPAGCVYTSREQELWREHKEFLKNKQLIFMEHMQKGVHRYEIELEPRFSGKFNLNPAKVSLMYFPVFYGRNSMRETTIE